MKAKQIKFSRSVKFFADRMMDKFDLQPYSDSTAPVVMYGLYKPEDYEFLSLHKPPVIVLWRGSDALILNQAKADVISKKKNCKHYAVSKDVQRSLLKWRIESEVMPITSTPDSIKCEPRGEGVYCYIGNGSPNMVLKYKVNTLNRLNDMLPYEFYFVRFGQYSFDELKEIYKKCFVGIRLLEHDGMSNSILEMGLMGRRTISNSDLPHTIKWNKYSDIYKSINTQYMKREKDNSKISDDFRKVINIGDKWLEV